MARIYLASSWRNPHQPAAVDGEEPELMALMANHIVTSGKELLEALGRIAA